MAERAHHALFPGSFDPVTLGHLDLVKRALVLFSRVTIGVAYSADKPEKNGLFSIDERVQLVKRSVAGWKGVEVVLVRGLVVKACADLGADVIVRGVRSGTDFDQEVAMARTNRALLPGVDTVLLVPAPEFAHVSSTLVRQIATLGGDASAFVPPPVVDALLTRTQRL